MASTANPLVLILNQRRWVIAFYLALSLAMFPGVLRLQQDNSPEVFFVRDAGALAEYRDLEFHFGRDRTFRVVLTGEGLWTRDGLEWIGRLEQDTPKLFGVLAAVGPYGHHRWRFTEWPPEPRVLRQEMLDDPLDRDAGWIGQGGESLTVVVGLYRLSAAKQRGVLEKIDALLRTAPPQIETSIAGLPAVNRAMDEALAQIAEKFFPLLVAVASLLLWFGLRRLSHVLLPFLLVGVCQLVVFGAMGYSGVTLNLVLIILAPLLLVITLATSVHVLILFRRLREQGLDGPEAVRKTYRVKAWPVVWTGLTTAIGFGSLTISRVPPVQSLGIWSAGAIGFMTLALLTLYPALLAGAGAGPKQAEPRPPEQWARRRGRVWAGWAVAHRRAVWLIFSISALALLAGVWLLRVETNLRSYFQAAHPLQTTLAQLEEAGIGALAAELVLVRESTPPGGPGAARFDAPGQLQRLGALAQELRTVDSVVGVVSAADLVGGIAHYAAPAMDHEARSLWAIERIRESPQQQQMLNYFLAREAQRTRITLFIPMHSFSELEPLFERALALARERFPNARVSLSGQYPLVLKAQKTLLTTMILSLSVTLLAIAVILRMILGSASLALRALLPNVWPVVLVLGVMGWSAIPVDSTTVMIAAVVLGLAVDDTLQLLGNLRNLPATMDPAPAAALAVEQIAGAHMLTSLVLAAGFGVLAFSSFVPVARFGGLAAVAILMALVADLLLAPALLAGASRAKIAKFRLAGDGG